MHAWVLNPSSARDRAGSNLCARRGVRRGGQANTALGWCEGCQPAVHASTAAAATRLCGGSRRVAGEGPGAGGGRAGGGEIAAKPARQRQRPPARTRRDCLSGYPSTQGVSAALAPMAVTASTSIAISQDHRESSQPAAGSAPSSPLPIRRRRPLRPRRRGTACEGGCTALCTLQAQRREPCSWRPNIE